MHVLIDNVACELSASTVVDAVAAAGVIARQRGRMIVHVTVNGREWSPDDTESQSTSQLDASSAIALTTAVPGELLHDVLRDASMALTQANRHQQDAADLLQADNVTAAMELLGQAFSIWSSVQQAVDMAIQTAESASLISSTASAGMRELIKPAADTLNHQLRKVKSALVERDTVALADTLLYDLPEVVEHWQTLIENVQQAASLRFVTTCAPTA